MTEDEVSKIIRMAWEDRTSFEEIYKHTKLTESDVIKIMRNNLKPASFKRWRERVSGRSTKHGKKFRHALRDQKGSRRGLREHQIKE